MEIKKEVRKLIESAIGELGIQNGNFSVEFIEDLKFGDITSNVAMMYAKESGISPKDLAEKIKSEIEKSPNENILSISVAGPGFLNFTLSPKYFSQEINKILSDKNYGSSNIHTGKKILVEHSSPNLFKPFHIGHVMNNAIGEAIVRLARFSGANVTTMSYPSDISYGIGKAVFAMVRDGGIEKLKTLNNEEEKLKYLGDCYVNGTKLLDADPELEFEIREVVKKIYNKIPSDEYDVYEYGRGVNLNYFKNMTARLGSHFDEYIFESEAGVEGKRIVSENIPNVFSESEGAVIYEGEKDGLHTRVFINKENQPTYEAKDLGLLSLKFKKFNPDISIFITDHEQQEYFKVVSTAAGMINRNWKDKTIHRTHGRMSFKGQKMSSRLGGVPIASELLSAVIDDVREKSSDIDDVKADEIAISAIKFSILRAMAGKNINFDPETSLSFEGDSGPYLQYAYVRARSLLEKAKTFETNNQATNNKKEISDLEKVLVRFGDVVNTSISDWAPHHIVSYLVLVAQTFNGWYGQNKILDENNLNIARDLELVQATLQVLKSGLYLLGITAPDRM